RGDQGPPGGAARSQSDAGPPRLPAGHHVPRDLRHAGARDHGSGLRGGRGGREGRARDHDPAHRHGGGDEADAGDDRPCGQAGAGGDGTEGRLLGGHHDRGAARRADRGPDRRVRGVLLVRHQRPDPDDVRLQPGRHRQVPALLPREEAAAQRSLRGARPGRGGGAGPGRHRAGSADRPHPQGGYLRRARRRALVGGVLPSGRDDLRLVLALHGAGGMAGGGPGASQGAAGTSCEKERYAVKLSGARIVLECIKREGVDLIFGLPGGAVLPIYDALYDFEGLRHILVRQEAAAGHAAEGYARTTGKVGVCLVTSGPAATNLVTALQDALMDSIPIVAFTGQVPTHLIGNDAFQEADNVGITRSATKHNFLVKDGKDLAPIIKEAFYIASTGRPGPVHVDLPKDILVKEWNFEYPERVHLRSYNPTYEGHPGQIKKAA